MPTEQKKYRQPLKAAFWWFEREILAQIELRKFRNTLCIASFRNEKLGQNIFRIACRMGQFLNPSIIYRDLLTQSVEHGEVFTKDFLKEWPYPKRLCVWRKRDCTEPEIPSVRKKYPQDSSKIINQGLSHQQSEAAPFYGAGNRTRTCTREQWNLNPPSLPIPPCPHMIKLKVESVKWTVNCSLRF